MLQRTLGMSLVVADSRVVHQDVDGAVLGHGLLYALGKRIVITDVTCEAFDARIRLFEFLESLTPARDGNHSGALPGESQGSGPSDAGTRARYNCYAIVQ